MGGWPRLCATCRGASARQSPPRKAPRQSEDLAPLCPIPAAGVGQARPRAVGTVALPVATEAWCPAQRAGPRPRRSAASAAMKVSARWRCSLGAVGNRRLPAKGADDPERADAISASGVEVQPCWSGRCRRSRGPAGPAALDLCPPTAAGTGDSARFAGATADNRSASARLPELGRERCRSALRPGVGGLGATRAEARHGANGAAERTEARNRPDSVTRPPRQNRASVVATGRVLRSTVPCRTRVGADREPRRRAGRLLDARRPRRQNRPHRPRLEP